MLVSTDNASVEERAVPEERVEVALDVLAAIDFDDREATWREPFE